MAGVIYNQKQANSRHSLDNCRKYVRKYFESHRSDLNLFGWVPPLPELDNERACLLSTDKADEMNAKPLEKEELKWIDDSTDIFMNAVDYNALFKAFQINLTTN